MNWMASGREKDKDGFKNIKLKRGCLEAIVNFKQENVSLLTPIRPKPFKDFIELERWLAVCGGGPETKSEADYLKLINIMLLEHKSLRIYFNLLDDDNWAIAAMKMQKSAYSAGISRLVTSGLIVDAMRIYSEDPDLSTQFLENLAINYSA